MEKENKIVFISTEIVLFPNSEVRFELEGTYEKDLFKKIGESQEFILVNPYENNNFPDVTMLPKIGVLAQLKLLMDIPNGKYKITILGLKRIQINHYSVTEDLIYEAAAEELDYTIIVDDHYKSLLIKALDKYISKVPYVSNAIMNKINLVDNITDLSDLVISFLPFSIDKKRRYVLELDPRKRCRMLIEDMNDDIQLVLLEEKIEKEVDKELENSQKEFYLRQKINAIQKELGDVGSKDSEVDRLKKKFHSLKCSPKIKSRIRLELNRYESTPSSSPEIAIIRDYLDWMLNLPWNTYTKDNHNFNDVMNILNESHYGLDQVKTRILEYLAVKQNTKSLKSPIICLVGPPGVGKTSLALSIATALNRRVCKMSVGGINDEAEIVGHRRTYVGACPGRVIQGIKKAKSSNPVFIIDEIDKMRKDFRGDPASSLLEVLDPSQNEHFSDHYIEEEYDLSKVMFIATANYIDQIPYELQDRLEIIEVPSYTEYEKFEICKNYIIPKALDENGITLFNVQFEDEAIMDIIRYYTKEAGVRELQREISAILRKIVKKLLTNQEVVSYLIDSKMILELLGKKKYSYNENDFQKRIGVVNGMAYTIFGGDILPIEATYYKGKGNLILTGSLGEVMKESAHISFSYVKAHAKKFGIDLSLLEENDIHIHVPEGAVNKDGPSAGITLTTVLISLFTKKSIPSTISMTGEMTLSGRILPIGGIREKVIGAHRAKIKTIYLPKENEKDLDEVDLKIRKEIHFTFVENYQELYHDLFYRKSTNTKKRSTKIKINQI